MVSVAATFFAIFEITTVSFIFSTFSGLVLIAAVQFYSRNIFSLPMIFSTFGFLYGISGPLAVILGNDLPSLFPPPYLVDFYLLHYGLGNCGLSCALLLAASNSKLPVASLHRWNHKSVWLSSVVLAGVGSALEIFNLYRAGGMTLLFAGKATYQSAISDLQGTMPSDWFAYASASLLGIALYTPEKRRRLFFLYLCSIFFIIFTWLLLGRRLELISIVLIALCSFSIFSPIKSLRLRTLLVFLLVYSLISTTYAFRGWVGLAYMTGDISVIIDALTDVKNIGNALNPISSEFHAPFFNFNTHVTLNTLADNRGGATYLEGLSIPIPRSIWPDKPIAITYEFRDHYFPFEALRGSIAGTGFSSILEAYINFGSPGVFFVNFAVFFALLRLESLRSQLRSKWVPIFYSLLVPFCLFFSRTALGSPLFFPMLFATIALIFYGLFKKNLRRH